MSKNLARSYQDYLNEEDSVGFGGKVVKTKKKTNETVEVTRSKNATTTRLKPKSYKNSDFEEELYYD